MATPDRGEILGEFGGFRLVDDRIDMLQQFQIVEVKFAVVWCGVAVVFR